VLPCAVMAMGAATAAVAGAYVHMYTVCRVVLHSDAMCVSMLQCVVYPSVCYCVL